MVRRCPCTEEDRLCLPSGSVGTILGKAMSTGTTDYWNTVNKQTTNNPPACLMCCVMSCVFGLGRVRPGVLCLPSFLFLFPCASLSPPFVLSSSFFHLVSMLTLPSLPRARGLTPCCVLRLAWLSGVGIFPSPLLFAFTLLYFTLPAFPFILCCSLHCSILSFFTSRSPPSVRCAFFNLCLIPFSVSFDLSFLSQLVSFLRFLSQFPFSIPFLSCLSRFLTVLGPQSFGPAALPFQSPGAADMAG